MVKRGVERWWSREVNVKVCEGIVEDGGQERWM